MGALDHDIAEHGIDWRHIMPVGPGHDERPRDTTRVDQQVTLAPIFSPVRRVCADSFLCKRRFDPRAINALPAPRQPFQVIILRQSLLPKRLKHARALPFRKRPLDTVVDVLV